MPKKGLVDLMALHMRLNVQEVKSVMPKDTFWFTVIRNPIDSYVSMFKYYKVSIFKNIFKS